MNIKLNLIPFEKKKEIEKNEIFRFVVKLEISLMIIAICLLAVLLCFEYILHINYQSNLSVQEKKNTEDQYVKIRKLDEQFSFLNSHINKIMAADRDQFYWSNLFYKLSEVIFPGIKIITLETSDYYITLSGLANNRNDLILFKEKMENQECFSNVDLPLSELVSKNNVEFQIGLVFKTDCLKNK